MNVLEIKQAKPVHTCTGHVTLGIFFLLLLMFSQSSQWYLEKYVGKFISCFPGLMDRQLLASSSVGCNPYGIHFCQIAINNAVATHRVAFALDLDVIDVWGKLYVSWHASCDVGMHGNGETSGPCACLRLQSGILLEKYSANCSRRTFSASRGQIQDGKYVCIRFNR